jgi:hypothetical protein
MYSFPSTSKTDEPCARFMKIGSQPTDLQALTGLFTPPGITCRASLNISSDKVFFMTFLCIDLVTA